MTSTTQSPPSEISTTSPVVFGTVCCIASALLYSVASICLRQLAELDTDEMWVGCIKEVVSVVFVGPWLLWRLVRGRVTLPPRRILVILGLTGLATQLIGSLPMQWAFGVVGLTVTIPAIFGAMLTASAMMGFVFLGERIPLRSVGSIGLLIVSIGLLSFGVTESAGTSAAIPSEVWLIVLGIGAGCLAGAVFAALTTVIRHTATNDTPQSVIIIMITGMGVVALGPLSLAVHGTEIVTSTQPDQWGWMLMAGTFNLLGFLAITKGLQLTTVVHANVVNASQVAIGAIAGILLFSEPRNHWIVLGICLTIAGIMFIGQPDADEEQAMEAV